MAKAKITLTLTWEDSNEESLKETLSDLAEGDAQVSLAYALKDYIHGEIQANLEYDKLPVAVYIYPDDVS